MKRDINRGARTDAKWCVKGKRGGVDHIPPSIKTTIFPKKKRNKKGRERLSIQNATIIQKAQ